MTKYCIGIDLGGTFIRFGALDADRQISGIFQLPTPSDGGSDGVVAQMVGGAKQLTDSLGISLGDIVGMGIGSPGPLDISGGVVIDMPNIQGMAGCRLRDRVSDGLDIPAILDNDANAAAYGEYLCGAGKGRCDLVMLTLGTGIGGGIVVDGKVLRGSHEIGAELGHLLVDPGGRQCGCGQKGCLEQYCSATNLARWAREQISHRGRDSTLATVLSETGEVTSRDVCRASKAGDSLASEAWDRAMYYLAVGCVSICRALDPDEIVLGGGMAQGGDDLMNPLMKHFRQLRWTLTQEKTRIVFSVLGNDAGVIGSAGLAWQGLG